MNLEDRESESGPAIAKQTQGSKPAFEWPEDQQDLASPADPGVKWNRREHLLTWALFWFVTWAGTMIAGALLGGFVGWFIPMGLWEGLLRGGVWTGAVGLFVFVHLGVIFWAIRWLGEPLMPAITAGFLTGMVGGTICLAPITAPLGSAAAYLVGNCFLKSSMGKKFLHTIKAIEDESLGSMKFTMMDMLLRVTALAVFIAGWSAWLKYIVALHRP